MTLRRTAPQYVRCMTSRELHGIAGRFQREQMLYDLSERQWWLWEQVLNELEYRWTATRPVWRRCSCLFCVPPFPEGSAAEASPLGGDAGLQ